MVVAICAAIVDISYGIHSLIVPVLAREHRLQLTIRKWGLV